MQDVNYISCSEVINYYITRKDGPTDLEIHVFNTKDEAEAKAVFELQKKLHKKTGVFLYKNVHTNTLVDSKLSGRSWDNYLFGGR